MVPRPRPQEVHASRWGRVLLWLTGVTSILLAAISLLLRPLPAPVLLVPGLLLLGTVILGVFWHRAGVFARPLVQGDPGRPAVALTFDDGPDPRFTPLLLDLLERHGARGTFFVTGERARQNPDLLREMARRGHQIENHSHGHSHLFPLLPVSRLVADLRAAQEAIEAATGRAPRWFRPPVGLISPPVAQAARLMGLRLCGWTRRGYDGLARTSAEAAFRRLLPGLRPGAILVLHDAPEHPKQDDAGRSPVALAVLLRLLPLLRERGLVALTLDALLCEDAETPRERGNVPSI